MSTVSSLTVCSCGLKSLTGFYDDSAWATSRRLWWDRCVSRTDRRKTRELLPGSSVVVAPNVLLSTCLFLFQIWDRLFPPQEHRSEGNPEEDRRKACTCVLLTLSPSSTARDVRPRPSDHGGVQTGPGQACLLCAGGIESVDGCGFVASLSLALLLFSLLGRVPWPSPAPWSAGCRTIWASSSRPRNSVRLK